MYPVFWHDTFGNTGAFSSSQHSDSHNMTGTRSPSSPLALGVSFGVLCLVFLYIIVVCLVDFMRARPLCPGTGTREAGGQNDRATSLQKDGVQFCGVEGGDAKCITSSDETSGRGQRELNNQTDGCGNLETFADGLFEERNKMENSDRAERHKSDGIPFIPCTANTNQYFSNSFKHRQEIPSQSQPHGGYRPRHSQWQVLTFKSASDGTLNKSVIAPQASSTKDTLFYKRLHFDQRLSTSLEHIPTIPSSSWPEGINRFRKPPSEETANEAKSTWPMPKCHEAIHPAATVSVLMGKARLSDSGFCPSSCSSEVNTSTCSIPQCKQNTSNSCQNPIQTAWATSLRKLFTR